MENTSQLPNQSAQSLLDHKFVGDICGTFFVPRYQRGYRWDKSDVTRLLDDILKSEGQPYSLQPVVLKLHKKGEDDRGHEWELIDGQQRLTTLYLIFLYMLRTGLQNVGASYSIRYETRPGSEDYLNTLDPDQRLSNIDFFHLYQAYECIGQWFDAHGNRRQFVANKFYGYLFDSVRVIWYQAPDGMDSTALFTRLNVGRIPLTDAELVKALLLSSVRSAQTDRAQELAAQWDSIERDLRNPDVWAFVAGTDADDNAGKYPTRISLLLDTLAPLPINHPLGRKRPRYHTFETLREQIENDPLGFWNRVIDLHALILGWFDDLSLYHKIGFLVAAGTTLGELVQSAQEQKKSDFEETLTQRIRSEINISRSVIEELSYAKKSDYAKCLQLLLLMNVETVRCMEHSTQRFPFRLHIGKAWSLEHIHAQNAESLNKEEQWKAWLIAHEMAIQSLPTDQGKTTHDTLLQEIAAALQKIDSERNFGPKFQQLAAQVVAVFNAPTPRASASTTTSAGTHSVHSISNLALLSNRDNSALSNSVFEVKRQIVLDKDRKGGYIPICTRNVFLKYYTGADAQQIHFWGPQDRESYLDVIISTLTPYLKVEEQAQ
jgi:hypothetical protein